MIHMRLWELKNIDIRGWQHRLACEFASHPENNYIAWAPVGMGKTYCAYLGISEAEALGRMSEGRKAIIIANSQLMKNQWYNEAKKIGLTDNAYVAKIDEVASYRSGTGSMWKNQDQKISEWRKLMYNEADIIISTPRLITLDIERKIFDEDIAKKVEMLILDEAGTVLRPTENPNLEYDIREDYKMIFNILKDAQKIGLTATPGKNQKEIEMLCRALGDAIIINPSEYDIEKYAPKIKRQVYYITDDWIQNVDDILKKNIAASIYTITSMNNLDTKGSYDNLLGLVRSKINSQNEIESAAAKGFISNVYARLLLYEHTFDKLHEYVKRKGWSELEYLVEERAATVPYSSKTMQFMRLIRNSLDKGEKVVVFDRFIDGCKELKKALITHGIGSILVTGDMSGDMQAREILKFKNSGAKILIATVGIGGAGIDLPEADVVIEYGISSSPAYMEQRSGRIRGGTEKCLIYKSTREEEKYRELQEALARISNLIKGTDAY